MFGIKGRPTAIAGFVAAIVLAVTAVAVNANSHLLRANGSSPNSPSVHAAGAPSAVYVATNPGDFTTTSSSLVLIPGMSITFTVSHRARVIMHFSDEAGCAGTTAGTWCDVEILVDGVEAAPGAGTDYAIDSSDGSGRFKWIGGALNRFAIVPIGTHTVTVVGQPVFAGDTLWSGENDLEVWVF